MDDIAAAKAYRKPPPNRPSFDPAYIRMVSMWVYLRRLEPPLETEEQYNELAAYAFSRQSTKGRTGNKPKTLCDAAAVMDPFTRVYLNAIAAVAPAETVWKLADAIWREMETHP